MMFGMESKKQELLSGEQTKLPTAGMKKLNVSQVISSP